MVTATRRREFVSRIVTRVTELASSGRESTLVDVDQGFQQTDPFFPRIPFLLSLVKMLQRSCELSGTITANSSIIAISRDTVIDY